MYRQAIRQTIDMNNSEYDFSDISPYDDSLFHEKMESLVKDPGFLHAVNYVMPAEDMPSLLNELHNIDNKHDFQTQVMYPFLECWPRPRPQGYPWAVPNTTIPDKTMLS